MRDLLTPPPSSACEPVTDIIHGVPITDPYRWLEDSNSSRTRCWLAEQTRYARAYLENVSGRDPIRERIRKFLAVETYDSLQRVGSRYFFRKRLPEQEQPCIYMREGADGEDQLLVDPAERRTGKHTAVQLLHVSPDGRILLYEVKEGGERTGTFELLETDSRKRLPDLLPHGYLRGFVFAPDGRSFYYVHESVDAKRPFYRAALQHVLGTPFTEDHEIFCAGENEKLRLCLNSGGNYLVLYLYHYLEKMLTDVYLKPLGQPDALLPIVQCAEYAAFLRPMDKRILAITDRDAPNHRLVEIRLRENQEAEWIDIVPETDTRISNWLVVGNHIVVSYVRNLSHQVIIYDFSGRQTDEMPVRADETIRLIWGAATSDELLFESESFLEPIRIFRYSLKDKTRTLWGKQNVHLDIAEYAHTQVWFPSRDGTQIPMFLLGRREVVASGCHPTIMTAYGGHGVCVTPKFSVFVAFLVERGCLFALPNIRGGSEFGSEWHDGAKRCNRQTAYDDFLCAAEWLIKAGRTRPERLAIFGGSNAGLLVGVALTQRPDLFRAVVCMVPMLDMIRYHLFDNAHIWKDEYGTVEDPADFAVLAKYSPYHRIQDHVAYPATMIISGDVDRTCNPLHARKMTARLQAANASPYPILLDYNEFRGHSPVLPLSERIEALTDRMGFLCDQLGIQV